MTNIKHWRRNTREWWGLNAFSKVVYLWFIFYIYLYKYVTFDFVWISYSQQPLDNKPKRRRRRQKQRNETSQSFPVFYQNKWSYVSHIITLHRNLINQFTNGTTYEKRSVRDARYAKIFGFFRLKNVIFYALIKFLFTWPYFSHSDTKKCIFQLVSIQLEA